jgi:MFS family permease
MGFGQTKKTRTVSSHVAASSWGADALLLFLVYVLSYMDRQFTVLLAHPIGVQLHATGGQIAGAYGTAFGVMFAVSGLVAAPIAARFQPWRWVAGAVLLWSASTMATAFVHGLGGLWAARVALAVGEAAAMPSIIALIGRRIPDRHWALASAAIIGGAFVGGGLAFAVSGEVTRLIGPNGWRVAFLAVGACGLPLALALWLRSRREPHAPADDVSPLRLTPSVAALPLLLLVALLPATWMAPAALALGAVIALLWLRDLRRGDPIAADETIGSPAFRTFLAAFGAILFVDSALFYWLPLLATERFAGDSVGLILGAITILAGWPAALAGGWIADRLARRSRAGRIQFAMAAVLLEGVGAAAALMSSRFDLHEVAYTLMSLGSGAWLGVAAATGLDLVSPAKRVVGTGLYFLVTVLCGLALGPVLVGALADRLGSTASGLWIVAPAGLAAMVFLWRLSVALGRDHTAGQEFGAAG